MFAADMLCVLDARPVIVTGPLNSKSPATESFGALSSMLSPDTVTLLSSDPVPLPSPKPASEPRATVPVPASIDRLKLLPD